MLNHLSIAVGVDTTHPLSHNSVIDTRNLYAYYLVITSLALKDNVP